MPQTWNDISQYFQTLRWNARVTLGDKQYIPEFSWWLGAPSRVCVAALREI